MHDNNKTVHFTHTAKCGVLKLEIFTPLSFDFINWTLINFLNKKHSRRCDVLDNTASEVPIGF